MAPNFKEKTIQDRSLGEILRQRREERGESFDDIERLTGVSKKYLAALETDAFKRLPDLVYSRNFVRRLAGHYGLDAKAMVESLLHEMSAVDSVPAPDRPVNFIHGRALALTPGVAKSVLAAAGFLAVIGYFSLSIHRILTPPSIEITTPKDNQAYASRLIPFEGRTEPEVELTINKEPVAIEADGSFKDTLSLPPGVSVLRVIAKKKHSKENELFIKVVVEEDPVAVVSATATHLTADN